MVKITEANQCYRLIEESKRAAKVLWNNTMLIPAEVEKYIQAGKLWYEDLDFGRIFFADEKDFYKAFMYIDAEKAQPVTPKDKPQIIEIIYSERRGAEVRQQADEICSKLGFRPYVENLRVKAPAAAELQESYLPESWPEELSWSYASEEDAEALCGIWSNTLDLYDSIIPRPGELSDMIRNKEIVCIRDGAAIVSAARVRRENKNLLSCWLVAVHPEHQRKGHARRLYSLIFSEAHRQGYRNVMQWCDRKNAPIFAAIMSFGFKPDGYISKEYIIT